MHERHFERLGINHVFPLYLKEMYTKRNIFVRNSYVNAILGTKDCMYKSSTFKQKEAMQQSGCSTKFILKGVRVTEWQSSLV